MKTRINISLDDVSPHEHIGLDSVFIASELINFFPDIKITLFVPTAITRFKERKKTYCILDYPKFVEEIIALPEKNFEIGYHGHLHGNKQYKSNNDEFRYLSEEEAIKKIQISKDVFDQTGIKAKPIFRPPGFWLSKQSFSACKKMSINVLALNKADRYIKSYKSQHCQYKYVVYIGGQPLCSSDIELSYHTHKLAKDCFNRKIFKHIKNYLEQMQDKLQFIFMEEFYGANR